jgi:hypothetical protein
VTELCAYCLELDCICEELTERAVTDRADAKNFRQTQRAIIQKLELLERRFDEQEKTIVLVMDNANDHARRSAMFHDYVDVKMNGLAIGVGLNVIMFLAMVIYVAFFL